MSSFNPFGISGQWLGQWLNPVANGSHAIVGGLYVFDVAAICAPGPYVCQQGELAGSCLPVSSVSQVQHRSLLTRPWLIDRIISRIWPENEAAIDPSIQCQDKGQSVLLTEGIQPTLEGTNLQQSIKHIFLGSKIPKSALVRRNAVHSNKQLPCTRFYANIKMHISNRTINAGCDGFQLAVNRAQD